MSRFYDGISDDLGYEQIVGTPEEILADGGNVPLDVLPPLTTLIARCDFCGAHSDVGRARFQDELVELPDGSHTSLAEWPASGYGDWRLRWRFKASCRSCGLMAHMPWGVKSGV